MNKEERKEYMKEYRRTHVKEHREASRRYYHKNKERLDKETRERYRKNKDSYIQKVKERKLKKKLFLDKYKSERGCKKCGESNHICLDFHHVNPATKEFDIANCGHSIKKIKEEIKKCIVLCANCHRKLHGKQKV